MCVLGFNESRSTFETGNPLFEILPEARSKRNRKVQPLNSTELQAVPEGQRASELPDCIADQH